MEKSTIDIHRFQSVIKVPNVTIEIYFNIGKMDVYIFNVLSVAESLHYRS